MHNADLDRSGAGNMVGGGGGGLWHQQPLGSARWSGKMWPSKFKLGSDSLPAWYCVRTKEREDLNEACSAGRRINAGPTWRVFLIHRVDLYVLPMYRQARYSRKVLGPTRHLPVGIQGARISLWMQRMPSDQIVTAII